MLWRRGGRGKRSTRLAITVAAVWTLLPAGTPVGRVDGGGIHRPEGGWASVTTPLPYNGLIAYVAVGPVAGSSESAPQVWVMTSGGLEQRALTSSYGTGPAWSPDGTQIAYVSRPSADGSATDIWVMDADGTNQRQVTDTTGRFESAPTWSPDGSRIAYVAADGPVAAQTGTTSDIWTIDVDGTDARNVTATPSGRETDPSWSPDGNHIAFACSSEIPEDDWAICLVGVDGTGRSEIARPGGEVDPAWSPDGSRLAFISSWLEEGWYRPMSAVFTMSATGADEVHLDQSPYGADDPAWSPDGRYIAVTGLKTRIGPFYISVMRSDGLASWCVACEDQVGRSEPAWQPVSTPPAPTGELTPLTPARILDTRSGLGTSGVVAPLAEATVAEVQVAGRGGIPSDGVAAVVMNVTVAQPTSTSYLTVWPTGSDPPATSNLNYAAGQTIPNQVTVAVGDGGRVNVMNRFGTAHVIFDVVGFYADHDGPVGGRYRPVDPVRLFDTRTGLGGVPVAPVGADETLSFGVGGPGRMAVVMNVTVARATEPSYLTVFPGDLSDPPFTSNLNFGPGQPTPNLVTVRVPTDGIVKFHNRFGSVDVIADLVGYFTEDHLTEAGRFVAVDPFRYVDTRVLGAPVGPDEVRVFGDEPGFAGFGVGEIDAAVLNVTVARPTAWSYLSVFPAHLCTLPGVSNLNFVAGQTVPNQVVAGVGTTSGCAEPEDWGAIAVHNDEGSVHVIVDVFGVFTASGAAATG